MTDPARDRPKTDQPGQNSAAGINITNQSLTDADREALYPTSPYTNEQMHAINAASDAIRRFLDRSAPDVSRLVFNADCDEMAQVALAAAGLVPAVTREWSVRYADGFVDGTRFTEAGARQRAAELGGEVVYRAVGPWQTAPTSEGAA